VRQSANIIPRWLELLMKREEMDLARHYRQQGQTRRPITGFTSAPSLGDMRREIAASLAGEIRR
jgi:hypothetical protein